MKTLSRFITFAMIVLASNIIITSCVDNNLPELVLNSHDSLEYISNTAKTLRDYNDSLKLNSETRGKKQDKWLDVVVADAKGAAAGITLGHFVGKFLGPHWDLVCSVAGGAVLGGASSYVEYNSYESTSIKKIPKLAPNVSYEDFCNAYAKYKNSITELDFMESLLNNTDSCSVKIGILHNKILHSVAHVDKYDDQDGYILLDQEKNFLSLQNSLKSLII